MKRSAAALAAITLAALPATATAASNITHRIAVRVDRIYEARGLGGRVLGCKVLKSRKLAACRVVWAQYRWMDVVTRNGGCTAHARQVGPHTYRVTAGRSNCYTGPIIAEHVGYSLRVIH